MIITVELVDRRWHVVDRSRAAAASYPTGAAAFDAAAALARTHHTRTGQASAVRVATPAASVEALRFSAAA